MAQIEITGWNAENESAEASGDARPGESVDDAVARICSTWGIVEIGDVRVVGREQAS